MTYRMFMTGDIAPPEKLKSKYNSPPDGYASRCFCVYPLGGFCVSARKAGVANYEA